MKIPSDLYSQILGCIPIPCVDLLVIDNSGYILLIKRQYEPARGQWWFPGGRVFYKEKRRDAAIRKLKEECDLESTDIRELGTFDVILENHMTNLAVHGITTLFYMRVDSKNPIKLDHQSIDADWRSSDEWCKENLDSFIRNSIVLSSKILTSFQAVSIQ